MIRYLSLDWINALSDEVASSEQLRALAEHHQINVTQVVTNGPEGDITYHLEVNDGVASFGAGAADPEDVRMQQEWSTAVAVATGELNAQEAFIGGQILLVRRPAEAARVAAGVRCARRGVRQRAGTHDVRVAETATRSCRRCQRSKRTPNG